ncbi:hypothetical protein NDU88_005864 [Pleurodeles waltl]|uniref:Uncharacterized protein n=1 Tax=Pleurodeles waltl TaxID=8319 RepID=A0AAV7QH00_PLEWA|nr:hypothetical protein NDU88_005864 [Pleurodeles waltl]
MAAGPGHPQGLTGDHRVTTAIVQGSAGGSRVVDSGTRGGMGPQAEDMRPTQGSGRSKEGGNEKGLGAEKEKDDLTKVWTKEPGLARKQDKPASAYVRPSSGDPPVMARETGLASLIPLAVKERIWRKEFINIFSLLEVCKAGLDLTIQDKKEEEKKEKSRPKVEKNIENCLRAFRTLANMYVEKFPESAAVLFLHEQRVHAAQQRYQGEAWLHYDKDFREKIQVAFN